MTASPPVESDLPPEAIDRVDPQALLIPEDLIAEFNRAYRRFWAKRGIDVSSDWVWHYSIGGDHIQDTSIRKAPPKLKEGEVPAW